MNQIDLTGKRAVITGGAQGIGRAVAERFVHDMPAVGFPRKRGDRSRTGDQPPGRRAWLRNRMAIGIWEQVRRRRRWRSSKRRWENFWGLARRGLGRRCDVG